MSTTLKLKPLLSTFVFMVISIVMFAQPVVIKPPQDSPVQKLDNSIMEDLAKTRTPQKNQVMLAITNSLPYVDAGVPVGLFIGGVIGNDQQMRQNAVYIASSTAISAGLTLLMKQFIRRPRPFIRNVTFIPVYRAGSTSFPSGHSSTSMATATALSIAYPKWYVIAPAYLWAGSVGYSRMYLGEHFPTDVAAGYALGLGSAIGASGLKR